MRILFMLPARSGSKGVPNKNIKLLNGKPLMWYAINAIKNSKAYKESDSVILLNTDSEEYGKIGLDCGCDEVMIRDEQLARDDSPVNLVIEDVFRRKKNKGYNLFAMIQVTSPLITSDDIDSAVERFKEDVDLECLNSVTETEVMPLWCNTLDEDLSMNTFISDEIKTKNRQELPTYYKITGAIRMVRWDAFIKNNYDFYKGNSRAFIMDANHSIDIDAELDFKFAEFLMEGRG